MLIAHSNIEMVAGWGFLLRRLDLTSSSAMNSAQENSDCCGSMASLWWPFPLPLTCPLAGTSSTVGPNRSSWWPLPFPLPLTAMVSGSISTSWYGKARYISTEDGIRVHEKDKDTWIPVPFPEIVDEKTWDLAQSVMKKRRTRSGRNTKIFYLLQHLVRCTGCGMLMGCMATRKRTVKRNGKVYKYDLETPRRYYKCYGVQHFRTGCREHTMIRAERLEGLVWGQVKKVMENPELIVAGIESLDSQEGDGLDEQIAGTERELQKVQFEENRAIRLYVSEKITEERLDRQRKFITERLETLRARLADYRSKETASIEKRALGEHVVEWANRVGDGLDDLPQEKRREVLRLLLDEVTIDRENNVNFTLAVPMEELESIGSPVSGYRLSNRDKKLRYTWTSGLQSAEGESR